METLQMIGGISSQSAPAALGGTDVGGQSAKNRTKDGSDLLTRISKLDPEDAERARAGLSAAQSLNAQDVDIDAQRKAAALEKIQRIKERLKALRMLAGSDPKAATELAARLSRELADAVKEYARANGGNAPSDLGANPSGAFAQAQFSGTAQITGAEGGAQTTTTAAAELSPEPPSEPSPPREAPATADAHSGTSDETAVNEEEDTRPPDATSPFALSELLQSSEDDKDEEEKPEASVSPSQLSISYNSESAAFTDLVRGIDKEIRKVLEVAKRMLALEEDREMEDAVKEAEKALSEVGRTLAMMSADGTASVAPARSLDIST